MDYDDIDFEGRQPLIAGEGSSKFSSVLLPYVIPKFDFDDGFQGHLRFDSLVENEIFLGIPSQEDNHWIETFPRGNRGIEFSSSAPESCSFSRHNNVWSEATSSESVEMLLKSVGQEEIVDGETTVEESDACDGGGLTKGMDPQLQQDLQDKHLEDPGSLFLSDGCQGHTNDVESTSQSQEVEVSAHESSFALDPNSSSEMIGVVMTENNVGFERRSVDVTRMEVGSTVNESSENTLETEPYGSEMKIDEMEPSARDNCASIEGSDTREFDHNLTSITIENAFHSSENSGMEIEEHHVLNVEVDEVDKLARGFAVESGNHNCVNEPCSSKTDSIGQNTIEAATSDLQGVSYSALRGSRGVQITEGFSKSPCVMDAAKASEPQTVGLSDSTEVLGGLRESLTLISEGDCNVNGKFIEVTTTSEDIRDSSELKVDQRPDGANSSSEVKDCLQGSEKLDSHPSGTESEASIISGVEETLSDSRRDGSCIKYVRDPALSTFSCSSTEFLGGSHTIETVEDLGGASSSAVHKEDTKAETGLTQNNRGGSSPIDQLFVQDLTLGEKKSVLFKNYHNLNSEFVESLRSNERVGPSSERECTEVRDESVRGFESLNTERSKPAFDVISEDMNLGFQDSVDAAPSPFHIVASVDQETNLLDKNYKTGNEGLAKANLLKLKEGLGEQSGLGSMMHFGRDRPIHLSPMVESWNSASGCEQSDDLLNKPIDQSLSMVESSTKVRGSENPINDSKNNQDSPKKLKACDTACNSAVKDGGDGEGLVLQDIELDAKNGVDGTSLQIAGFVRSICGKNSAPECTMLSENEKDEVEANGSTSKSSPLSEVTVQSTQVLDAGDGSILSFKVDPPAGLLEKQTTKDGESITPTQVCPPHRIAGTEILLEPSHESPQECIRGKNYAPDCTVLSENEKDEVGANRLTSKTSPLSEVTVQSTRVLGAGDGSILSFEVDPSAGLLEKHTSKDGESLTPTQVCPPHMIVGKYPMTPSHKETEILLEPSHESHQENNGDVSADSIKPTCGNVIVSSCTVLSGSKMNEKGSKVSTGKSSPLSGATIQPYQSVIGNDGGNSLNLKFHPSAGFSEKQASKIGQSITTTQEPHTMEGSPGTPSASQFFSEMHLGISHRSSQDHYEENVCGTAKGTLERKRKRAVGGGSLEKGTSKRGNYLKKTTPLKQPKKEDKSCNVLVGNLVSSQLSQLEGLKPYATIACTGIVTRSVASVPTSNFPDLNTSAPPLLFQLPFTDTQQLQLRAQIIVYGSLIQGASPDEAIMVSAFGASDGGRSIWEPSWHACLKRVQCQKSHTDHSRTPAKPLSGVRPFNKSIKQKRHQSKLSDSPSPLSRAGGKVAASAAVNSIIPLSSPLWNMSTPDVLQSPQPRSGLDYHQSVSSPLHPFQTPTHSLLGHNASRLSQTSYPVPWISSAKTPVVGSNVRLPVLPMLEVVKLTPVKGLSSCVSHETKHVSHVHQVHSTSPNFLAVNTSLHEMKQTAVSRGHVSTDQKARERENVFVSGDPRQFSLLVHPRTESVSIPVVTCHLSTSVVISTPNSFVSKSNTNKTVTAVATASSTGHLKQGEHKNGQKVDVAVDASNKVEESKQQAENAAALAAAALSHSHSVWSQLDKHRNSGLVADAEAKLASAAVAVAAAASVAKAAAAAAKIASNIALQAKLMADEVSQLTYTSNPAKVSTTSLPDVSENLGKAPVSFLKCGNVSNNTSSIIGAAREAARSRIEASSAVLKHAENVDAIVKAAELAAEAVTQAGNIVAIGDPLSLNELIAAGPDGYWRVPLLFSEQGVMSTSDNGPGAKADSNEGGSVPHKQVGEGPSENENTITCSSPRPRQIFRNSMNDCMSKVEGSRSALTISEKNFRGKMTGKTDLAKTIGVIPESEFGSGCASRTFQDENENGLRTLNDKGIKEGCLVEVYRDGDKEIAAWFSASVLSLKDGKAFICYTELQADEDSGKLKEWVIIEDRAATSAPRIRIAHPMTTIRFEGTRKRRRDAMANYAWSVGDRVDVWAQACWREAVVAEKNRNDETSLTVLFQAEGETSVVKAWYLRPTLIWKNGQWVEWSISKGKDPSYQGDTPKEKRKKLGVPAVEGVEKDNTSKSIELNDSSYQGDTPNEKRKKLVVPALEGVEKDKIFKSIKAKGSVKTDGTCLLPLSANEKIFNAGKYMVDQHRPTVRGALRTGLKKEGSGVIFGVPTPGNKPKFMDVSKQYVVERNSTTIKSNDSGKFAKCLMPQGAGSRGWRNQTRPVTKMNSGKLAPRRNMSAAEVKKKLNNDDPGSLTSEHSEPRRSHRRIKPTSRLLEGIQTSLMISKIPSASHDKSHRSEK